MRKELAKIEEVRATFTGTFARFGIKNGWRGADKTVLLQNVKNSQGKVVTDHLWFNLTVGFQNLDLHEGDSVQFDARVKEYEKGYKGYRDDIDAKPIEIDYKLSHPTKLKNLSRAVAPRPKSHKKAKIVMGICPRCGKDVVEKLGSMGKFLGCSGYPKCKAICVLDESGKLVDKNPVVGICSLCGEPVVERQGRKGNFLGCSGYPKCKAIFEKNNDGKLVFLKKTHC